jgi:pimeloyl-ACP methyl ester carboxylesterase
MTPAHYVEIRTPKGVFLNGLWWGPKRTKKVIIIVHGLTGSIFSMRAMTAALVDKDTAVLTFNNRGFGQVNTVKKKKGRTTSYLLAGTAHEVFTDCMDDIDGALRAATNCGAKDIFLAGHSTGCQKIAYWASRRKESRIRGLIHYGPLSDYSGAVNAKGAAMLERGVAYAKRLVAAGREHELMPAHLGEWFACDAQRFLSLYTPESAEEIFSYARPRRLPRTLRSVRRPQLVLLAGADEYGDRPAEEIYWWFLEHIYEGEAAVVPNVGHSFKGGERKAARLIKDFMKECLR